MGVVHGSTPTGVDLIVQQVVADFISEGFSLTLLGITTAKFKRYLPPTLTFPIIEMPDDENGKRFEDGLALFGQFILQIGGRTRAINTTVAGVTVMGKHAFVVSPLAHRFGQLGHLAFGLEQPDPTSAMLDRLVKLTFTPSTTLTELVDSAYREITSRLRAVIGGEATLNSRSALPAPPLNLEAFLEQSGYPMGRPVTFNHRSPSIWLEEDNCFYHLRWFDTIQQDNSVEYVGEVGGKHGYIKRFSNLRLMAKMFAGPLLETLSNNPKVVVIGATGYSSLKAEDVSLLGISSPACYTKGAETFLTLLTGRLIKAFPAISWVTSDGCSDAGIDRAATSSYQRLLGISPTLRRVAFTCTEYLWYAADCPGIAIVSNTTTEYGNSFAGNIDCLLALGGREHALKLDLAGVAGGRGKILLLCPIVEVLSGTGTVPVPIFNGKVTNATVLFGGLLRVISDGSLDSFTEQLLAVLPSYLTQELQDDLHSQSFAELGLC